MKLAFTRLWYAIERYLFPHRSTTVRVAFPIIFVIAAALGAAVVTNNDGSYIRIRSDATTLTTGQFFTIDVLVGAKVPVNAVDIALAYPEDQIEIDGIDIGESVITIWTQEPYIEGNKVILRGGTFRRGFTGEHIVAQINARAKKSGNAKFTTNDIKLLAGDGRGTEVSISESGEETLTLYVDVKPENGTATIGGELEVAIYTDINGDGTVDMSDIRSFMSAWFNQSKVYDFNHDGKMTFVDFAIILSDSFFK